MGFWRFQPHNDLPGTEWIAVFDYELGVLAAFVALLGAYALFPAVARGRASEIPRARIAWHVAGALCMAVSFWGMKTIGMLGFGLPVQVGFDLSLSLLAPLPAAAGAFAAIRALSSRHDTLIRFHVHLYAAALSLCFGFAGMHLLYMEALVSEAAFSYSASGWLLALGVVLGLTVTGLHLSYRPGRKQSPGIRRQLAGSVLVASGALGMHFGAMAATRYWAGTGSAATAAPADSLITAVLVAVTLTIGLLFLGALIDQRMGAAVRALRWSELRSRAVIETMLDAHLIFDERGIISSFNLAAENLFGYAREEIVGRHVTSLMAQVTAQRFTEWLADVSASEPNLPLSTRQIRDAGGRRRDGECFPIEYGITSFGGDRGREFSCVVRDLSDQWATRERLETLASAVEYSSDGIVIMDRDRIITYANRQFERQTGSPAEELIGRPASEVTLESSAGSRSMWEAVAHGRSWSGHLSPRRPDGSRWEVDVVVTPLRNAQGDVAAHVAVYRDVTKSMADAHINERLAAAVRYAADSIEILDAQGRIEYVNPAYEFRQSTRLADVRGRRPEEVEKVVVHDGNYYDMLKASRDGGRTWSGILRSEVSEGRVAEEHVTVSPILDDQGQFTSFVIVKRDLTETRRLETQLQQAKKLEAIGQLAAGVAHEINTPAQFVSYNLKFLEKSFGAIAPILQRLSAPGLPAGLAAEPAFKALLEAAETDYLCEEIPKAIDQSLDGCDRIARIVQAMNVFSHPNADMAAVDINRAIQSTITVASTAWKYVANLDLDLDPALPSVICQAGEINQVILNLLINAAHAISDRMGENAAEKGTIVVSTRGLATGIEIRVADNGKGIPIEIRERIFDPFFTTKEVGKGTGQGLAIAHDVVVRKHKGTIDVESEVGKGTTFIIQLPQDPPTASLAA